MTHAWSIWGDDPNSNLMRVQEAALLAGSGITYGSAMYDQYIRWSEVLKTNWEKVLQTVNANKALFPAASRTMVPTGTDPKFYAMQRTSEDGAQTAVLKIKSAVL